MKYFLHYLKNRFPLFGAALYLSLIFFSFLFFPHGNHDFIDSKSITILTFLIGYLFLFHLRLMDDIKDYDEESLVVSKKSLKVWLSLTMGIELILAVVLGMRHFIFFLFPFTWSLLMYKEFFCRSLPKKWYPLYLLSHQIVLPFLGLFVFSLNKKLATTNTVHLFFLSTLTISLTMVYDITRKLALYKTNNQFTFIVVTTIFLAIFAIIVSGFLTLNAVAIFVSITSFTMFTLSAVYLILKKSKTAFKTMKISGLGFMILVFASTIYGFIS